MSWAQVHSNAQAAARASLEQETRKSRGLEVTAKPAAWKEICKGGLVRHFVGAPQGVYWKNTAFYVVDASLDANVIGNRHVVSYRSYVKKEGILVLDVPFEVAQALEAAVHVRIFRVDGRPLELLRVRCEVLDELDRGPMVERLWSPKPVPLRQGSPRHLPPDRSLNDGQQSALAAMTTPGGFFVWGPPGTGKTTVITSALNAAIERGQSVLITSHTNVAVDNVLESLVKDDAEYALGVVTPGRIVRQIGQDSTRVLEAVREHPFLRVDRAAAVITNRDAKLRDLDRQRADNGSHVDREHELKLRNEIITKDVDLDAMRRLRAAEPAWNELLTTERRRRDTASLVADLTALQRERTEELEEFSRLADEHAHAERSATAASDALAHWNAARATAGTQLETTGAAVQTAKAALEVADLRLTTALSRVFPWVGQRRKLEQARASLALSQARQSLGDAARSADEAEVAIRHWTREHRRWSQEVALRPGIRRDRDRAEAQVQDLRVRRQNAEGAHRTLTQRADTLRAAVGDSARMEDQLRHAHRSGNWALTVRYDELLLRVIALDDELAKIDHRRARLEDEYEQTKIKLLSEAPVVAATLTALITNEQLRKRRFDVVIVDESASAEAPLLLIAAAKADKTLAIVGDFLQNAPIAEADDSHDQASEVVKRWQTLDIFALAGITDRTSAEEHPQCVAIAVQYRYPPIIAKAVNRFCYDGLLQSHKPESADHRPVIIFVDTSEFTDGSLRRRGNSWECPRSRDIALHLGSRIQEGTVGYVTPYRPQADAMAQTFASAGLSIPTGTSHEFQGREFDTVIFDLMQDDQPRWVGTADLGGRERAIGAAKLLNVALTRAKEQLYIIGNWQFVRDYDSPGMQALAELNGDPGFELRTGADITSVR